MSLNESANVPYVLGRLFSVLEAVQSAANPGINTTIRDRYFNSACATPALVFPTLIRLAQKHLQKPPQKTPPAATRPAPAHPTKPHRPTANKPPSNEKQKGPAAIMQQVLFSACQK